VLAASGSGKSCFLLPQRSEMYEIFCSEFINSFGLWRSSGQGAGVYVASSLINHSCAPNILRFEEGSVVVFRAAIDIPANTELNISYIGILDDVHVRRRWLDDGFHFHCMCPRCKKDDLAITKGRSGSISSIDYLTTDKCPIMGCDGLLGPQDKLYPTESSFCSSCGIEQIRAGLFARPN